MFKQADSHFSESTLRPWGLADAGGQKVLLTKINKCDAGYHYCAVSENEKVSKSAPSGFQHWGLKVESEAAQGVQGKVRQR